MKPLARAGHFEWAARGYVASMSDLIFQKSSYSDRSNCVEVADLLGGSQVRDSQNRANDGLEYRTSSYSDRSDCVAFAETHGGAVIRDSQHPDREHLPSSASEWVAFLHSAEA